MGRHPLQLVLIGPPGAGKGTQAARLADRLGLVHISPGQILREQAAAGSPDGRKIRDLMAAGELVPDELINKLVYERLAALAPEQGFVLDGYPRTPAEARSLRRTLARLGRLSRPPVVVWLDVPREVLAERLRRRRDEQDRPDDSDAAIMRRLEVYEAGAEPLRGALAGWSDLVVIDGDQPPDAITEQILRRIGAGPPRSQRSSASRSRPARSGGLAPR